MVEVAENNLKALVLLSEKIFRRDKDILKGNIGSTSSWGVRRLDGLGLDAWATFNHQDGKPAFVAPASNSEIVRERSVSDPFLCKSSTGCVGSTVTVISTDLPEIICQPSKCNNQETTYVPVTL